MAQGLYRHYRGRRYVAGVATGVRQDMVGDWTIIRYHWTDIVKFKPGKAVLNSGGYHTATTAKRMNQVAREFNLPFSVHRKQWTIQVVTNTGTYPLVDGMEITW